MSETVSVVWTVEQLDRIVMHWVKEYASKEGTIVGNDWWLDPIRRQVVFRLFVKKETER